MKNNRKMKVYLSGGMRKKWRESLIRLLPEIEFYDPTRTEFKEPDEYTSWDLAAINACDVVFCLMEEDNPSGIGMALEIGYARAKNKLIIMCNEKDDTYLKICEECANINTEWSKAVFILGNFLSIFGNNKVKRSNDW